MVADDSGAGASGNDLHLEAALDELFGGDPKEFVATRTRLVRTLRAQGDAAAARTVQAKRRPTKSAWALNALARTHPGLLQAFFARSEELRVAQSRAAAGQPGSQRDANRAQREALSEAADAAVAILGPAGETARVEILSTLQGAAVDAAFGAVLRAGCLERTEVAATGLGDDLAGGEVVPAEVLVERRSRRARPRDPKLQVDRDEERERRKEGELRSAADALTLAEASLRDATRDAEAATARVAVVEARAAALRDELDAARLELRKAKDLAAATMRQVSRRTRDVDRLRRKPGDRPL